MIYWWWFWWRCISNGCRGLESTCHSDWSFKSELSVVNRTKTGIKGTRNKNRAMRLKVLCSTRLAVRCNTVASCGISKRPPIHSLKEQIAPTPSVGVSLYSSLFLSLFLPPFFLLARSLCLPVVLKGHPHLARHPKWTVKSHLSLCLREECVCSRPFRAFCEGGKLMNKLYLNGECMLKNVVYCKVNISFCSF